MTPLPFSANGPFLKRQILTAENAEIAEKEKRFGALESRYDVPRRNDSSDAPRPLNYRGAVEDTFPRRSMGTRLGTLRVLLITAERWKRRSHAEHGNELKIGVRPLAGPNCGLLEWRTAATSAICKILNHPIYAGICAYGRTRVDPRSHASGGQNASRRRAAPEDYLACLPGRLGPSP